MSTRPTQPKNNPLEQRKESTNPHGKSFVLHTLSLTIMINSFLALQKVSFGKKIAPEYGGLWQFLTILGLLGSGITLFLAAASDLLPAISFIRTLKRVFMILSLPVEIVISSIYWPIVILVPHLMLPPKPDAGPSEPSSDPTAALFYIPLWMDLGMHALPAAVLLFDFMFLEKKYGQKARTYGASLLAMSAGTGYACWVEHCASINGRFPYPFLTIMSFPARVATYIAATLGALFVFWALNAVHK